MYSECINCTLRPALFRISARWDSKLPDNLFIAPHEQWHISRLGKFMIAKPSLVTLPQSRLVSVVRLTQGREPVNKLIRRWVDLSQGKRNRAYHQSTPLCLIVTGRWDCTPRPDRPQIIKSRSSPFKAGTYQESTNIADFRLINLDHSSTWKYSNGHRHFRDPFHGGSSS